MATFGREVHAAIQDSEYTGRRNGKIFLLLRGVWTVGFLERSA